MKTTESLQYASGYGLVVASYDTWVVDVQTADGGLVTDVAVMGPRLPEASTPERPQWVFYEFADHSQGRPRCYPVAALLPGNRDSRTGFIYYEEVGNYRMSITRDGVFEVINRKDPGTPLQVRVIEDGNEVRLDTPKTSIVLRDDDGSITITAEQDVTVNCTDAAVNASGNVDLQAGGNISAQAGGNISALAGGSASITATGAASVTAIGAVTITGATVAIN